MTSTPRPACYTASFLLRPPEPDEFLIIFLPSQEIGELGVSIPRDSYSKEITVDNNHPVSRTLPKRLILPSHAKPILF